MRDPKRLSLYMPEEVNEEIRSEADRLDRSISWLIQQAWRIARSELRRLPSAPGKDGAA